MIRSPMDADTHSSGPSSPKSNEALDVTLSDGQIAELDGLTAPALDYPHNMIGTMVGFQQGDTTINGLTAQAFVR
ncbi:hypothetical protein [Streptomyces sp. NPDC005752]|uniref:hypothetical protein n=1 Tax=Streptomyces sp. NPDC005752 TaxID=3157065 RepID=UPI003403D03F